MAIIPMKALLESGVHFGHRTNKWDPRMKPYIFTERNGIHIIDLQQTVKLLNQAYTVIRDTVANGGTILFVGTKRQAQETITDEATRCGMPYVTERWLGVRSPTGPQSTSASRNSSASKKCATAVRSTILPKRRACSSSAKSLVWNAASPVSAT